MSEFWKPESDDQVVAGVLQLSLASADPRPGYTQSFLASRERSIASRTTAGSMGGDCSRSLGWLFA